eukprot:COSAG02_NODE_29167_length_574_cov_1.694737_1_plen_85_part_10
MRAARSELSRVVRLVSSGVPRVQRQHVTRAAELREMLLLGDRVRSTAADASASSCGERVLGEQQRCVHRGLYAHVARSRAERADP